jgi:hypothetical protein
MARNTRSRLYRMDGREWQPENNVSWPGGYLILSGAGELLKLLTTTCYSRYGDG